MKKILIVLIIVSILIISSCSQIINISQESAGSDKFLADKNYCEQDSDCVIREFVCQDRVQNKYYPYDREKEMKYASVVLCAQPILLENPRCTNNKCTADKIDANNKKAESTETLGNITSKEVRIGDKSLGDKKLDNKVAAKAIVINENNPPILQNIGINIEPWDKATNKAGDFLFDSKRYVNNKIFTEFGEIVEGDKGKKTLPEIGFNVPVGTTIISPIDGIVTDVKLYEPSQDYIVSFKTEANSPWIISFEHVEDVSVAVGDKVIAGQKIAKVSLSYGKTEFGNVEIAVWQGGINIVKYCPTMFLKNDLKQEYTLKFNQLAADWESFRAENVYKQEDWVSPGCLLNNLTEK